MLKVNKRYFLLIAVLLVLVLIFLGDRSKLLKQIVPNPGAVYIGEYSTSFPDSRPGVGVIYESQEDKSFLVNYYQAELIEKGWIVTQTRDFDGFSNDTVIYAKKGRSYCYISVEEMASNRKITIKIE